MWSHVLIFILSLSNFCQAIFTDEKSLAKIESESNKVLSRHRRFFFPEFNSTWTFITTFTVKFPLEGWDMASFEGKVPIVTTFDANEYKIY